MWRCFVTQRWITRTQITRSTAIKWCKVIKHSRSQGKKLEEEILAVAYGYRGEKENKNGENPEK